MSDKYIESLKRLVKAGRITPEKYEELTGNVYSE